MPMYSRNKLIKRAILPGILLTLVFFALLGRFLYIEVAQKAQGHSLKGLAEERATKEEVLTASRGNIYDRQGRLVAQDVPTYSIYAILKKSKDGDYVKDPEKAAMQLAPFLGFDEKELYKRLSTKNVYQVEFGTRGKNLNQEVKDQIDALNIKGIHFTRESKRLYRYNDFASYVIGYTHKNDESGKLQGVMGVEKQYNDLLKPKDGLLRYQGDRYNQQLPSDKEVIKQPQNGKNIYLTIDPNIQNTLETTMNQVNEAFEPKRIMAIAVHPKTGAILAMSSRPSFDPNLRNLESFTNDVISSRYEPGSTMKIFTLAAAIESGVYNGQSSFPSGQYKVPGGVIRDHNSGRGWGSITFDEGIERSSNVAVSILAREKMGLDTFYDYLSKFGLDKKTNVDLPGEINSQLGQTYEIERVTTAFGQGSAFTPIQLIRAGTAIANDGKMMEPYIVEKVVDESTGKVVKEHKPTVAGTPISEQTSKQVRDVLERVVYGEYGTGKMYQLEGTQVVGKTGTAQVPEENGRGYMTGHGNYVYSFLGMAPKDAPEMLLYVVVDRPKLEDGKTGEMAVSTIFNEVMKSGLKYLEIDSKQGSEEAKAEMITVPNVEGLAIADAQKVLTDSGLASVVVSQGTTVQKQIPAAGEKVLVNERILLQAQLQLMMPDMTGWALRDVLKFTQLMDVKPEMIGTGYVISQNIPAHTEVKKGEFLSIELRPPDAKK